MIRLIGKKGKKMNKKINFAMTKEREAQIKSIKKQNVIDRSLLLTLSPVILGYYILSAPFEAVAASKNQKKGKAKIIAKELLSPVPDLIERTLVTFKEGTQKLTETYKNFAADDKKAEEEKVDAQRKRQARESFLAANKKRAEEKGIPEFVELVKTKTIELKTDSDYIFVLDNGVEVFLSEDSLTIKESKDNQCTISLNNYEYGLFVKAIDSIKIRLEYQKNRNMREMALGLLNKENVRK